MVCRLASYRSDAPPRPRSEPRLFSDLRTLTGERSSRCTRTTASPSSTLRTDPSAYLFVEPSPGCHHRGPCSLATLTSESLRCRSVVACLGEPEADASRAAVRCQTCLRVARSRRCRGRGSLDVGVTTDSARSPSPLGGVAHSRTPEGVLRRHRRPPVKEADATSGFMRGEPGARKGSEPVPLSGRRCPCIPTAHLPLARRTVHDHALCSVGFGHRGSRRNPRGCQRARWFGHPKAPSPNPRRSSRPSRQDASSATRPATSVHTRREAWTLDNPLPEGTEPLKDKRAVVPTPTVASGRRVRVASVSRLPSEALGQLVPSGKASHTTPKTARTSNLQRPEDLRTSAACTQRQGHPVKDTDADLPPDGKLACRWNPRFLFPQRYLPFATLM